MDFPEERFHYHIITQGTNVTQENVLTPYSPFTYEHTLETVSFRDVDNGVTLARLIDTNGVTDQFLEQWTTLTADVIYGNQGLSIPIRPGSRFGVAFYGITSGDALEVVLTGTRKRLE